MWDPPFRRGLSLGKESLTGVPHRRFPGDKSPGKVIPGGKSPGKVIPNDKSPEKAPNFNGDHNPQFCDPPLHQQQDCIRNTVNFKASIWGDQFLKYDETEDLVVEKQLVDDLTQIVKKELRSTASSHEPMQHQKLIQLIDAAQRLGIAYHFEEEIEEALQHIYGTYGEQWVHRNNLQSTSLWFRLLRQHGFSISSEIFKNYMGEDGRLGNHYVMMLKEHLLCMKRRI
nr:E-beta-farnesene synthase 1 [Tanacetum cinerariifolium]